MTENKKYTLAANSKSELFYHKCKKDAEQSVFVAAFRGCNILLGSDKKALSPWENFASAAGRMNWTFSLSMTAAQNTFGFFRTSTSKLLFSPKCYKNGWMGNQYLKTFDVSHVGKLGGRALIVTGIVVDGFSWENGTITGNKFIVNTGMALWGLTGVGTVTSIFYFGTEAFAPGGFKGF